MLPFHAHHPATCTHATHTPPHRVYQLESFLDEHPGGVGPILKHAGADATAAFDPVHPRDVIERYLAPELCLGEVDPATLPVPVVAPPAAAVAATEESPAAIISVPQPTAYTPPPLGRILNLRDFEEVAQRVLKKESWAYYSSAADDEVTLQGAWRCCGVVVSRCPRLPGML